MLTKAAPVDRMSSSLSAVYKTTLVYSDLSANNRMQIGATTAFGENDYKDND
jgi:hypothetical protein